MNRLLITAFSLAAATAAASPSPADASAFEVAIEAGKLHEVCMRLDAGEKRIYHWKASGPVEFNIHYHEGPEVFYPVKRDGMRGDGGSFTAKTAQEYCWMWSAKRGAVQLSGGIK